MITDTGLQILLQRMSLPTTNAMGLTSDTDSSAAEDDTLTEIPELVAAWYARQTAGWASAIEGSGEATRISTVEDFEHTGVAESDDVYGVFMHTTYGVGGGSAVDCLFVGFLDTVLTMDSAGDRISAQFLVTLTEGS